MSHRPPVIDCALVLAAGGAQRMGVALPKALLPLAPEGPSFLGRMLDLLLPTGVERVFVVVRAADAGAFGPVCRDGVELVTITDDAWRPGSTTSLVHGLQAVDAWRSGAATLVADGDLVFERALLDELVARCDRSRLYAVHAWSGDSEEVRVYGRGAQPVLLGKGLPREVTRGLDCLGESLGLVYLAPAEQRLAASLARWLVGTPPGFAGFGYAGARSEHEEVWQYLFAMERLAAGVLPGGLLFSECDDRRDYERVTATVYPAIVAREGQEESVACAPVTAAMKSNISD